MAKKKAKKTAAPIPTPAKPGAAPRPEDITRERKAAQLKQEDAAYLLHRSLRAWEEWESGRRDMPAALWECFTIKLNAIRLRAAGAVSEDTLKSLGIVLPGVEMPRHQWMHMKVIRP